MELNIHVSSLSLYLRLFSHFLWMPLLQSAEHCVLSIRTNVCVSVRFTQSTQLRAYPFQYIIIVNSLWDIQHQHIYTHCLNRPSKLCRWILEFPIADHWLCARCQPKNVFALNVQPMDNVYTSLNQIIGTTYLSILKR